VPKPSKPLTPLAIANLKTRAQRYEVSDGGCQGLRVVVFPSRRKSFIVRYRFRGLQRKLTLGPILLTHNGEGEPTESPALDTPLSLAAARQLCTKALREAKAGRDPASAKQQARAAERAAEGDTLENIAQEYLRRKEPGAPTTSFAPI
jgi:Arm DNA-binding domain